MVPNMKMEMRMGRLRVRELQKEKERLRLKARVTPRPRKIARLSRARPKERTAGSRPSWPSGTRSARTRR